MKSIVEQLKNCLQPTKANFPSLLYFLAIVLALVGYFCTPIQIPCYAVSAFCFLVKIILTMCIMHHRENLFLLLFLAIMALSSAIASNPLVILMALSIAGGIKVNPKAMLSVYFLISLLVISGSILLCVFGVLDYKTEVYGDDVLHWSFGFSNPNGFGCALLILGVTYICVNWEKQGMSLVVFPLIVAVFALVAIESRTAAVVVIAAIFMYLGIQNKISVLKYIFLFIPVSCFIFALFSTLLFDPSNDLLQWADALFSGRLSKSHEYLSTLGVSILGQIVDVSQVLGINYCPDYPMDCAYVALSVEYGLIPALFLLGLETFAVFRGLQRNDYTVVIAICSMALYGFMEMYPLFAATGISLGLIGYSCFEEPFDTLSFSFNKNKNKAEEW